MSDFFSSASVPETPLPPPGGEGESFLDQLSGAFFRKIDWAAFWTVFAVALGVYWWTLAPTVTLEDSGELAVASDYLGVPHPPGYPIWTLLTWFFQWIFHFVKYNGHPNPAWGVGFCSAVSGAGACGVLALLVSRSGAELLRHRLAEGTGAAVSFVSAVSGGLLLAFSPVLWSQSVIVEVYSLNALFQMGVLLLIYMWMCRPKSDKLLYLAAFLFGLGLTNHQTLLFLGLALAVAVLMKDADLFRDFAVAAVLMGAVFVMAAKGVQLLVPESEMARFGQSADGRLWKWSLGPDSACFWVYNFAFLAIPVAVATGTFTAKMEAGKRALWALGAVGAVYLLVAACCAGFASAEAKAAENFSPWLFGWLSPTEAERGATPFLQWLWTEGPGSRAVLLWLLFLAMPLAVAFLKLPHGRTVAAAVLLAEIGVAFYLYLPVASEQNPPMNWGYSRTWQGFMHAVTRGQYDAITPTDVFSVKFIQQLGAYLTDLRSQFSLPIAILGFLPFCAWSVSAGKRRIRAFQVALGLALAATLFIVLETMSRAKFPGFEKAYRLLIAGELLLSGFGLFAMIALWLKKLVVDLKTYSATTRVLIVLFLLGAAGAVLWVDAQSLKAAFAPGATKLLKGFFLAAVFGPPVAIAAAIGLHLSPVKLDCDLDVPTQRWLITSMIGFLSVSVIFLIFQNPTLDLQNLFIGRVQFIQSHAFYALWIGYGAALAAATLLELVPARRAGWTLAASSAVVLLLPCVLLWQNAYDKEQVRVVGGAEQNGHTFGWQFGNWELEGVKGIKEDFGYWYPDEEDFAREWGAFTNAMGTAEPDFPPPMTEGAVFYGGTDPGRFVPTYMIYSADVRPDVYLITQNALADNTFMNITRDLYGDTIYIPSASDSDNAFRQYVQDVESGKASAGADIAIENGRVSVKGVQGVMTINGLLAKLIFDENKARHDFYVEESYAIQWMYPYLTPHGLIMKIEREPLRELPPDIVEKDHRFWTWYTGWLLGNSKFTRDICARKSFSKLRSAIAGVYEFRRDFNEAEFAYKQAIDLYPLSPEAVLRLAQMYLNIGRSDDAEALLRDFIAEDPHSDSAIGFLDQIARAKKMAERRIEIERKQRAEGAISLGEAVELVQIYREQRAQNPYRVLMRQLLQNPQLPTDYLVGFARLLAQDGNIDLLAMALEAYTTRDPRNAAIWLDLAAARTLLGQYDNAMTAVRRALDLDPAQSRETIIRDPRFQQLAEKKPELVEWVRTAGPAPLPGRPAAGPLRQLPNLPGLGL